MGRWDPGIDVYRVMVVVPGSVAETVGEPR